MSGDSEFTRREFVTAVAAVGAVALATQAPRALAEQAGKRSATGAAGGVFAPQLLLFDPEHADACRRVEGAQAVAACETLPVTGDRVRFGLKLFSAGNAPAVVAGLTHYADYILLSGCAAEHGYRVLSVDVQTKLVEWTVAKRRSTSS